MQPNYPPPPGAYQTAPPQAYPPPPAQYAPAPPPPPVEQAPLNLVDPSGGQGGSWAPAPRHLIQHGGYACLLLPRSFDPSNTIQGANRPQITYDMLIVGVGRNGEPMPPIEFGDSQDRDVSKQRPNVLRLDVFPAMFTGVQATNQEIVKELSQHVGSGALIPARFIQGTQGNRPPLLEKLAPEDPARAALVEAWHNRTNLVRTVGNGLTEINGGLPKKDAAPSPTGYGQPAQQYPGAYAQAAGMPPPPGGYGPPPGQQVNYQQAPPPPPPPPGAYPPPPGPAPVPAAAAAQGWTAEQWAAAPPHVKAAYGA